MSEEILVNGMNKHPSVFLNNLRQTAFLSFWTHIIFSKISKQNTCVKQAGFERPLVGRFFYYFGSPLINYFNFFYLYLQTALKRNILWSNHTPGISNPRLPRLESTASRSLWSFIWFEWVRPYLQPNRLHFFLVDSCSVHFLYFSVFISVGQRVVKYGVKRSSHRRHETSKYQHYSFIFRHFTVQMMKMRSPPSVYCLQRLFPA